MGSLFEGTDVRAPVGWGCLTGFWGPCPLWRTGHRRDLESCAGARSVCWVLPQGWLAALAGTQPLPHCCPARVMCQCQQLGLRLSQRPDLGLSSSVCHCRERVLCRPPCHRHRPGPTAGTGSIMAGTPGGATEGSGGNGGVWVQGGKAPSGRRGHRQSSCGRETVASS